MVRTKLHNLVHIPITSVTSGKFLFRDLMSVSAFCQVPSMTRAPPVMKRWSNKEVRKASVPESLRNGKVEMWYKLQILGKRVCVKKSVHYLGYEVLTAVVMQNTVFWDITLCSPFKVNIHFGGTYHLHLQIRISRARFQRKKQVASTLLATFFPWRWRRYVPPKRRLTFNGLHCVMSHKTVLLTHYPSCIIF
jgi:hypothetical protein